MTRLTAARLSLLLGAALALSACQNKPAFLSSSGTGDQMATASTQPTEASFKRTEELSQQWKAKPADTSVAIALAENLAVLGQRDQQLEVLEKTAAANPGDGPFLEKAGKQALAANKADMAVGLLERAAALPTAQWQTFNALGSAYDQQGRHDIARQTYAKALQINPSESSVQNNLAMSYSLEGNLPEAEKELRRILASPGAGNVQRIRQNLALVVGLQGRFDEARKIASEDLPPDQVEANLAYLQQMLEQPNTWQQLSNGETAPADPNG